MADVASKAEPGDVQASPVRIFHATMAVALRLGFGKITMDTVAREAGLSKGGLLYHFKTKNHLIAAMLEYYASPTTLAGGGSSGTHPFMVAMMIAAADNPALLEPYRDRIGGTGPLVAELVERFCCAKQALEPRVESQAFAVRHKGVEGLFGLFVAQDADMLWDMVDEFSDPAGHEYRLIENGALLVSEDAEMSGGLTDVVAADGDWKPFHAADEGSGAIARITEGMNDVPQISAPESKE